MGQVTDSVKICDIGFPDTDFAWTYLREGDVHNELLRRATTTAEPWRDSPLAHALLNSVSAPVTAVLVLTDTELRVLQFLPSHRSMAEISKEMFVSVNTVKTHVRAIYLKLRVKTRSEAVHRAREMGLIGPA